MSQPTIHPGKALLDDMCELNLNLSELAAKVGLEPGFVRELLAEHEDVTPEVADKLARLGTSAEFWLNLQQNFNASAGRGFRQYYEHGQHPFRGPVGLGSHHEDFPCAIMLGADGTYRVVPITDSNALPESIAERITGNAPDTIVPHE